MTSEKPCVHLVGLRVEQDGIPACENLSFRIEQGTLTAFVGRQAACWNTIMRLIAGQQVYSSGQVELWGVPVPQISRRSLNSLVCFVPRQQQPLFAYPVFEYVMQGCEPRLRPMQAPEETDREMARSILRRLKIANLTNRDCSLLDNRERQLVILARAIMQEARLLLFDEPLVWLRENEKADIMRLFAELAHDQGKTVVIALEDPWMALESADRLIIFENRGVSDILDRQTADFRSKADTILQRLLLLDPAGHLLDLQPFSPTGEEPSGRAESETNPFARPAKNDRLF